MRSAILLICFIFAGSAFAGFDEAAEYNAANEGVSLVVLQDGTIVFEDYPNNGAAQTRWELASGTKSFSGVLAAAAVQDGLLSLDEPVSQTLTEWQNDPRKSTITIRQLLNLTSGIKTHRPGNIPTYAEAIASPALSPTGETFAYGPTAFQIFGEIMRRKLKDRYDDPVAYLDQRIFKKIEISPRRWNKSTDGYPRLSMGADLSAREWARFGEFVRLGGNWKGEQLIDRSALDAFTRGSKVNPAYGLTWWLNKEIPPKTIKDARVLRRATDLYVNRQAAARLPDDLLMAAGAGNQRLYIIPSRNLVIVRQSGALFGPRSGRDFSDTAFLTRILSD